MAYSKYIDFEEILKEAKIKTEKLKNNPKPSYDFNSCKFLDLSDLKVNSDVLGMLSTYDFNYFDMLREDYGAYYFENGKLYIACKMPKIEHEIAHIVYMNNFNRLILNDFGYKIWKDFLSLNDKLILKILIAETRVRGIQSYLLEYSVKNLKTWLSLMLSQEYLGKDHVGKFSTDELESYLIMLFERERSLWSFDKIQTEFNKRMDFVFSFLENNKNYTHYSNNFR